MARKFIAKATANAHGQFSAKAAHAGESTLAFAHSHDSGNSKTAKQSRLAETLIGLSKHRKKK